MFILVLFLLIFPMVSGAPFLQMEIKEGHQRCIGQELDQEDLAFFSMKASGNSVEDTKAIVHSTIMDPDGKQLSLTSLEVGGATNNMKLNIDNRGVHQLCFTLYKTKSGKSTARVAFNVDYKNRGSDPSKKVGKDELPTLENHLKAAEDSLNDISKEIDFARRQEVLLRQAGEKTSSRIQWFGFLSIIVLLLVSLWQIVYLRHFFASKKLL